MRWSQTRSNRQTSRRISRAVGSGLAAALLEEHAIAQLLGAANFGLGRGEPDVQRADRAERLGQPHEIAHLPTLRTPTRRAPRRARTIALRHECSPDSPWRNRSQTILGAQIYDMRARAGEGTGAGAASRRSIVSASRARSTGLARNSSKPAAARRADPRPSHWRSARRARRAARRPRARGGECARAAS